MHSQQKHDQSNKIHAVQEIQGRAGQTDYLSLCTLYNFIVEFHIQWGEEKTQSIKNREDHILGTSFNKQEKAHWQFCFH